MSTPINSANSKITGNAQTGALDNVLVVFYLCHMNWSKAMDINRIALVRIIAALMAIVESNGASPWIPIAIHRAVARILRPAESAVRRLILIASRKLLVPVPARPRPKRKWPEGLVVASKGETKRQSAFRLFDPIRSFVDFSEDAPPPPRPKVEPRIRVIDFDPRVPEFLRSPPATAKPGAPEGFVSVRNISERLSAVTLALQDIPRQARRLLRSISTQQPETRRLVLRPGSAPGSVKKPRDEVHHVLKECHALARFVLSENSS